jgi:hypothetical protein
MRAAINGSSVCIVVSSRRFITPLEAVKKSLRVHREVIWIAVCCGPYRSSGSMVGKV